MSLAMQALLDALTTCGILIGTAVVPWIVWKIGVAVFRASREIRL